MKTLFALLLLSLSPPQKVAVQDGGKWAIHYTFENKSDSVLDLSPLTIDVEGDVSNSAGGHPSPVTSKINIKKLTEQTPDKTISEWKGRCKLNNLEYADACHERGTAKIKETLIQPRQMFSISIFLAHEHLPFGDYHPLLGKRKIHIQCGEFIFDDTVDFQSQEYVQAPLYAFVPPADHTHKKYPDTLFLSLAGELNSESHKFSDVHIRYNTKMVLSFRYMLATPTYGSLCIKMTQYLDGPESYKVLDNVFSDIPSNKKEGIWHKYKNTIQIAPNANVAGIQFKIAEKDDSSPLVGDVYIQDIKFHPVGYVPTGP